MLKMAQQCGTDGFNLMADQWLSAWSCIDGWSLGELGPPLHQSFDILCFLISFLYQKGLTALRGRVVVPPWLLSLRASRSSAVLHHFYALSHTLLYSGFTALLLKSGTSKGLCVFMCM